MKPDAGKLLLLKEQENTVFNLLHRGVEGKTREFLESLFCWLRGGRILTRKQGAVVDRITEQLDELDAVLDCGSAPWED